MRDPHPGLGQLLEAIAAALPPLTPEEEAAVDARRERREQAQREREARRAEEMGAGDTPQAGDEA